MDDNVITPELLELFQSNGLIIPSRKCVENCIKGLDSRGYVINECAASVLSVVAGFELNYVDNIHPIQPISFDMNFALRCDADFFQEVFDFFGKKMSPIASVFHDNAYLWCDDAGDFYVAFWPGPILKTGSSFSEAISNILFHNERLIKIGEIEDDIDDD